MSKEDRQTPLKGGRNFWRDKTFEKKMEDEPNDAETEDINQPARDPATEEKSSETCNSMPRG